MNSKKTIILTQVDSWFFRDGRPFNMNEFSQSDISSIFPPYPPTVVGAIRAGLARAKGWNGCGSWSDELKAWIGDGPNLGKLKFNGPYLIKDGEVLFPAPMYLGKYKKEEDNKNENKACNCLEIAKLGSQEVDCDLGKVRMPTFDKCKDIDKNKCKWKPLEKAYLTKENMELVLKGEDISNKKLEIVEAKELWNREFRLGIELDKKSKTTKEGALYSTNHIRLRKGIGLGVVVVYDGVDEKFEIDSIIPFGGESRLANVKVLDKEVSLPNGPKADELEKENGKVRFSIVHITPAYFTKMPNLGEKVPGTEGKVVFAFLGRPAKVGGWDSLNRTPLPLKSCIPAGSSWFCEADANVAENIVNMNGEKIGEMTEYGFGQILIGNW